LYLKQERVLGSSHFRACVEAQLDRVCAARGAHRPAKAR
jgi:hypothetical protein